MIRTVAIVSMAVALSAVPVAPARALSLADAERQALARNRDIALGAAAVDAAQAGIISAAQRPNPSLSVQTVNLDPHRGIGGGPLSRKAMDTTVGVSWLVERGDKRRHRLEAAEAQLQATRYDLAEVRRQQRLAVHLAYFDLKQAQERLRLLDESSALARQSLDAAERRVKAGDLAPIERSRLRVETIRADNERRAALADLASARQTLATLLGDPQLAAELSADDPWPLPVPAAPGTPAEAAAQRPDLRGAAAREEAARRGRELARSLATRDVTLGAQYERFPPDNRGSFGVSLSIPLFWGYRYQGEIAKAEADWEASRVMREKVALQAFAEVQRAHAQLAAARDKLAALEEVGARSAQEAARGIELAYARGAASLTDLLDARRQLRAIQLEIVQARADYAKALAAWRAATEWEQQP
jgi:cobalt-zinc-cadmium efflux system outer membrane protein